MQSTQRKIPINIITGFLGSGKTTLLARLLKENGGRKKIAILMNEIGEVSIDAKLLEGYSVDMFELNDGCICCSVNEDFLAVIDEIAEKYEPDLCVIETTGIANPISIIYSLYNPRFVLDAVITTVDACNFLRMKEEINVADEQVSAADVVLLTKTDIAPARETEKVEAEIRRLNPHCRIFSSTDTELGLIFGMGYHTPNEFPATHSHHHAGHHHHHLEMDGIETFRYQSPMAIGAEALQFYLDRLPKNLWRLKGIVRLAGYDTPFIVNYAYGRHTIEDYTGQAGHCDLVFIGKHILNQKDDLISKLEKVGVAP
ncbi:MAG: GTP-binding protein [Chlorobiales bacterium]|nr:GTP-binding protein [Chlorobiales bacterium]